eukprot:361618-Chlamydomonas_euryale.AAC.7
MANPALVCRDARIMANPALVCRDARLMANPTLVCPDARLMANPALVCRDARLSAQHQEWRDLIAKQTGEASPACFCAGRLQYKLSLLTLKSLNTCHKSETRRKETDTETVAGTDKNGQQPTTYSSIG